MTTHPTHTTDRRPAPKEPSRPIRSPRQAGFWASVTAAGALAGALALMTPAAGAAERHWDTSVERPGSADELGLPANTPAPKLARAAIQRAAGRLGVVRSLPGLKLARDDERSPGLRTLRFRQTAGGLRVVWSEIDVMVSGDRVGSINATTVPLKSTRLSGRQRLSPREATDIARRAVPGPDSVAPAELVAYAGTPAKPAAPRRAFVVQVTRAGQKNHAIRSECIIVDAQTGEVIGRWPGTAAMQDTAGDRRARAAAANTVLYQMTNFKRKDPSGFPYGLARVLLTTNGDPFKHGDDVGMGEQFLDQDDTNIDAYLHAWAKPITRYLCVHPMRRLCGRTATNQGEYKRHFIVGNHTGDQTYVDPSKGGIVIGENDADDPDVFAHELGHAMDYGLRNDYIDNFESREVNEALGDMFSNDIDRDGRYQDGPKPTGGFRNPDDGTAVTRDFIDPQASRLGNSPAPLPSHINNYSCTTTEPHHNAMILAHAFHKLVIRIGYDRAGQLLTYVPMALPAQRRFGDVRKAFADTARNLYNGGVAFGTDEQHVKGAFGEVGVSDGTRRTWRC